MFTSSCWFSRGPGFDFGTKGTPYISSSGGSDTIFFFPKHPCDAQTYTMKNDDCLKNKKQYNRILTAATLWLYGLFLTSLSWAAFLLWLCRDSNRALKLKGEGSRVPSSAGEEAALVLFLCWTYLSMKVTASDTLICLKTVTHDFRWHWLLRRAHIVESLNSEYSEGAFWGKQRCCVRRGISVYISVSQQFGFFICGAR